MNIYIYIYISLFYTFAFRIYVFRYWFASLEFSLYDKFRLVISEKTIFQWFTSLL